MLNGHISGFHNLHESLFMIEKSIFSILCILERREKQIFGKLKFRNRKNVYFLEITFNNKG